MHIFLSFAALALAGQAAAAGQCSLQPLDDKTLQQLTGGQSGGTTVTSGSMSGPSPARTSTQPKRRAVSTSSHLVRRAGTGETPQASSGSSSAVQPQPLSQVPSNRQPTTGDDIEMMPPPAGGPATTSGQATTSEQSQQSTSQNQPPQDQAPGSSQLGPNPSAPAGNQDLESQTQDQTALQQQGQGQGRNPIAAAGSAVGSAVGKCVSVICTPLNAVFNYVTGANKLRDPAAVNKLRNDWGRTMTAGLIAGGVAAFTITRQTAAQSRVAATNANIAQQNQQLIDGQNMLIAIGRCMIPSTAAQSDFCAGLANPSGPGPVKRAATLAPSSAQSGSQSSCPKMGDQEKSQTMLNFLEKVALPQAQAGQLSRTGLVFDGGSDAWVIFNPDQYPKAKAQLQKQGMIPTTSPTGSRSGSGSAPAAGGRSGAPAQGQQNMQGSPSAQGGSTMPGTPQGGSQIPTSGSTPGTASQTGNSQTSGPRSGAPSSNSQTTGPTTGRTGGTAPATPGRPSQGRTTTGGRTTA